MAKTHITAEGDTFDALALEYYNDEKLASAIIQANPDHCDTLIFEAGISLRIPEVTQVTLPETLPPWRRDE
jgi:phage tail protein X